MSSSPWNLFDTQSLLAFVTGTKGGLLEGGHKRQTQCMDFWIIQKLGNNSSYTNGHVMEQIEGPSPTISRLSMNVFDLVLQDFSSRKDTTWTRQAAWQPERLTSAERNLSVTDECCTFTHMSYKFRVNSKMMSEIWEQIACSGEYVFKCVSGVSMKVWVITCVAGCLCMCMCGCASQWVQTWVSICEYMWGCLYYEHAWEYACVFVSLWVYVNMGEFVWLYVRVCICENFYVWLYMNVCVCMRVDGVLTCKCEYMLWVFVCIYVSCENLWESMLVMVHLLEFYVCVST